MEGKEEGDLDVAYSPEERANIQEGICRLIASGLSIRKACLTAGTVAESTVFKWLYEDADFSEQYARARERRADARAERIDDICDRVASGELKPDAGRVIIDAEKWQAGKENSKRYGDRLQLDADMTVSMTDDQLDARLAKLLGKAGAAVSSGGEGTA